MAPALTSQLTSASRHIVESVIVFSVEPRFRVKLNVHVACKSETEKNQRLMRQHATILMSPAHLLGSNQHLPRP